MRALAYPSRVDAALGIFEIDTVSTSGQVIDGVEMLACRQHNRHRAALDSIGLNLVALVTLAAPAECTSVRDRRCTSGWVGTSGCHPVALSSGLANQPPEQLQR